SAVRDSRSPKKTRASGIANIGAVDESTVETATPAYLTDATNITELSAVRTPSATSRTRAAPPVRPRPLAPTRAHGVAQSTIAATIESARSARALVDAAANAPTPTVAATQPSRSAPPTVERAALTTTEPSPG